LVFLKINNNINFKSSKYPAQKVNLHKTKAKANGKHIEESDTDELEKELVRKSK
jgi:hypothetical protein